MADNSFVAVNMRMLIEKDQMYGVEPLLKKFDSMSELNHFLRLIVATPSGTYKRFTWEHK